jgi:hypothetical protein
MKRALMFLLLGPALVVLATWVAVGMPPGDVVINVAVLLFLVTLPLSGIAGLIDGLLSTVFPILARVPLTAMVGAMAPLVLLAALLGPMPQGMPVPFMIGGALCAGVCSLLAHDYNAREARPDGVSGSPS